MKIIIFLVLIVLLTNNALAFGVGSPYFENNPLIIKLGETKETYINLQNMVGGEDVVARVEVNLGKELAKISNPLESYDIPLGSEINIPLTISIPKSYKEGSYNISLSIKTESQNKGQLSLSQGINIKIPLIVKDLGKEKTSFGLLNILLILISIILLIVIYILVRKHKKSQMF